MNRDFFEAIFTLVFAPWQALFPWLNLGSYLVLGSAAKDPECAPRTRDQ